MANRNKLFVETATKEIGRQFPRPTLSTMGTYRVPHGEAIYYHNKVEINLDGCIEILLVKDKAGELKTKKISYNKKSSSLDAACEKSASILNGLVQRVKTGEKIG